jgi:16S rRNA G966 N2-methylase RsmD
VGIFLREAAAGAHGEVPFDVVLVDPPYADTAAMDATLAALGAVDGHLVADDCWVVAKHFWRTPPPPAVGLLASVRSRRFGESMLTFYRRGRLESQAAEGTDTE